MSKSRSKASRAYAARVKVWKEDKDCFCAFWMDVATLKPICKSAPHPCDDVHHTRGKIGALLMDERFWLPVCRTCHNWIGNNIAQARSWGLLCELGEWNKVPRDVQYN